MLESTHTISWNRPSASGAKDALGHTAVVPAPGFPVSVTGSWQPQSRRGQKAEQGIVVQCDAVFYSTTFTTGKAGDIATGPDGRSYLCLDPLHNDGGGLSLGHSLYRLTRVQ